MGNVVSRHLQSMRVIWLAMLSLNFIFAFVGATAARSAAPTGGLPTFIAVFGAVALGTAVLSVAWPRRAIALMIRTMKIEVAEDAGDAPGGYRQAALTRRRVADPARVVEGALVRWQWPFIVGLALADTVSMCGLYLALLARYSSSRNSHRSQASNGRSSVRQARRWTSRLEALR